MNRVSRHEWKLRTEWVWHGRDPHRDLGSVYVWRIDTILWTPLTWHSALSAAASFPRHPGAVKCLLLKIKGFSKPTEMSDVPTANRDVIGCLHCPSSIFVSYCICVGVSPACVPVHYVRAVCQEGRIEHHIPCNKLQKVVSCHISAEKWAQSSEQQPVLVTTEPSSQTLSLFFFLSHSLFLSQKHFDLGNGEDKIKNCGFKGL